MIKLYGIKTERGTVYTTAAYEGSLPVVSEQGWFVSEDELQNFARKFWNAGYIHRDSDDLAPPDFTDYWQVKKKEIL